MTEASSVPVGQRAGVFVTVGTDHHPFDRLISWMDSWLTNGSNGAESFIQYGTSRAPTVATGQEYVSHDEMERLIANAGAIVCHGGPGTIIDCMRSGIKPIVVPRRHAFGEHVDDHQVRFARRLEAAGYIKVAADEDELGEATERGARRLPRLRRPRDRRRRSRDRFPIRGRHRATPAAPRRRPVPRAVHRGPGTEWELAPGSAARPTGSLLLGRRDARRVAARRLGEPALWLWRAVQRMPLLDGGRPGGVRRVAAGSGHQAPCPPHPLRPSMDAPDACGAPPMERRTRAIQPCDRRGLSSREEGLRG